MSMAEKSLEEWGIFICYRQIDGKDAAQWLHDKLHGSVLPFIPEGLSEAPCLDVYFDQTAAAVGDFTDIHQSALQQAKAFLIVCSPGAKHKNSQDDWVHRELEWWIENRDGAPIIIDPTGEGERWIPDEIKKRWPNAQQVSVHPKEWENSTDQEPEKEEKNSFSSIIDGICSSERHNQREELEREKKRSRQLEKQRIGLGLLVIVVVILGCFGWWQQRVATDAKVDALAALADFELVRGSQLIRDDRGALGAAHLFKALQAKPDHPIASRRLLSYLLDRNHFLPTSAPWKHPAVVSRAKFNYNGTLILTVSEDHVARLFDLNMRRYLNDPVVHKRRIIAASFTSDGKRIMSVSQDGMLHIQGASSISISLKNGRYINAAAFSHNGLKLITITGPGFQILDVRSGKRLLESIKLEHYLDSGVFSPDGKTILTTSTGRDYVLGLKITKPYAQLWDAESGKTIGQPMEHEGVVYSASYSFDGRRILTSSQDGTAKLWNASDGRSIGPMLHHNRRIDIAIFSPDASRILTASHDQTAQLWDLKTGKRIGDPMRHDAAVSTATFSEDGERILTASLGDRTFRLWDGRTSKPVSERGNVNSDLLVAALSPNGSALVTYTRSRDVQLWDAFPSRRKPQQVVPKSRVLTAALSPDGKTIATGSKDGVVQIWKFGDDTARTLTKTLKLPVSSIAFNREGTRLVAGMSSFSTSEMLRAMGYSGGLGIWDVNTGETLAVRQLPTWVQTVEFSPDGAKILIANDHSAFLLDTASLKVDGEPLIHEEWVSAARFSPDGKWIATSDRDRAWIWDSVTRSRILGPMKQANGVSRVAFSSDGTKLVTASEDHTAQMWDVNSGESFGPALRHGKSVRSAVFSPEDQFVVTGSEDHTIRIWDSESGEALSEPLKHEDIVYLVFIDPQGHHIFTVSGDAVYRWDLPSSSVPDANLLFQFAEAIIGPRVRNDVNRVSLVDDQWRSLNRLQERFSVPSSETSHNFPVRSWFKERSQHAQLETN